METQDPRSTENQRRTRILAVMQRHPILAAFLIQTLSGLAAALLSEVVKRVIIGI